MKKLLFGMGALTWMVINLAIIYWIGKGAMWLITQSLGSFLGHLALGLVMIFFLILLSFLSIGLIGMVFDDHDKWLERLSRWFPFMNLNQNKMQCIKCGKPATKRYSPDLDVKGIGMCDEHEEEIKMDLLVASFEGWDKFEKKYLKEKKE